MALCTVTDLQASACANGFTEVAAHDELFHRALLQLLKTAADTTESFDEIYLRACDNGFVAASQSGEQWRRTFLSLLCGATA